MRAKRVIGVGGAIIAGGLLLGWPTWAAVTWTRYGHVHREMAPDPLLDRYLPVYEVADAHETRVAAPAALTYAVATGMALQQLPLAGTIIRWRERLMRVRGDNAWPPGGIVAQMRAWGWSVLAEAPGREVVLGTVTQPWQGNVQFRALAPDELAAFDGMGYVKIVVMMSAEPAGPHASIFRVRTRVATTDPTARARFRRYWAIFSPGILLIRYAALRAVKHEAERTHARPAPILPHR
jgi:hypothetical protein